MAALAAITIALTVAILAILRARALAAAKKELQDAIASHNLARIAAARRALRRLQ